MHRSCNEFAIDQKTSAIARLQADAANFDYLRGVGAHSPHRVLDIVHTEVLAAAVMFSP